jgi:hypothetical protein
MNFPKRTKSKTKYYHSNLNFHESTVIDIHRKLTVIRFIVSDHAKSLQKALKGAREIALNA